MEGYNLFLVSSITDLYDVVDNVPWVWCFTHIASHKFTRQLVVVGVRTREDRCRNMGQSMHEMQKEKPTDQ